MKTVIEMAREAEFDELPFDDWTAFTHNIERFAELVRDDEREACLQIADDCADADMHASMVANALRERSANAGARGNTCP